MQQVRLASIALLLSFTTACAVETEEADTNADSVSESLRAARAGAGASAASERGERKGNEARGGRGGTGGTGGTGGSGGSGVGDGDIRHPVSGPPPTEASKIGGKAFKLVKNWDFGTNGTIRDIGQLSQEFDYHDQFGTIANGTNYGAVIVAPNTSTAISAYNLNLPNDRQPVEDPARPYRTWTASTLKTYVRPLDPAQPTVDVSQHNTGCGSFMAKWALGRGGKLLGQDVVWETRLRIATLAEAYWLAVWSSGNKWDNGAEADVLESFGAPHTPGNAFHSDVVGGTNNNDFSSWPDALTRAGVPESARDLTQMHTWTWAYFKDDTYAVYYDGYKVQSGSIHWTAGGVNGTPIDLRFLFDLGWGHTKIADVNISRPASTFALEYEVDYSRVYLR
jgi:hypothetical protein